MSRSLTRSRRAQVIMAAAVVTTLLGACGAGEKDATSSSVSSTAAAGATGAPGATAESAADAAAGVDKAKQQIAGYADAPTWPTFQKLAKSVDVKGKTFTYIPFGDGAPVMHGIGEGVKQAFKAAGATVNTCDGKFNPTSVASCLKAAGDAKVDGVITAFVDYQMAGPAFDALAKQGVKVIVGGVAPSGGRKADSSLAFYDNTPRVITLHKALSADAIAQLGKSTNVLWARLMDSSTTQNASLAGIKEFKELCPSCGIATTEFSTVNVDKFPSAVSAALVSNPKTNALIVPVDSYVAPALQGIQSAGFAGKVKVFSASGDLAGLQRVKAGQQASDLGAPVLYEGWRFTHAMMQLLAGETVSKGDEFITRDFTAANIGGLSLDAKTYLSDDWYGGGAYKDNFLTAWGLK